jgi:ABC-type lipoprotein export system ATPase subunit
MIELEHVSKRYRMGDVDVHALDDVSVRIEEGEYVAIIGPSGSGKSTLLHLIGCLDRPDTGTYRMGGRDLGGLTDDQLAVMRNRMMGFVFQHFYLLPYANALENVELPLIYAGKYHLKKNASVRLGEVGLLKRAAHRPREMSGGEQQRVAIARALVHRPRLLVCDEPTSALDERTGHAIMELLCEFAVDPGRAVLVVTHDSRVFEFGDRTAFLNDGNVVRVEARSGPRPTFTPPPQMGSAA